MNKPVMQEREPDAPTLELSTTDVGAHLGNEAGGAVTILPKRDVAPQSAIDASSVPSLVEYAIKAGAGIDTIERLVAMQERAMEREALRIYNADLADLVPELPVIEKKGKVVLGQDKNGRDKGYGYAKWEDINPAILPIMKQYGFSLFFKPSTGDGKVTVKAILAHKAGHREEAELTLPFDTSGGKSGPHAAGSSISYAKRFLANSLLNLTSRDGVESDDDAQGASALGAITAAEHAHLVTLINEVGVDTVRFCKYMKVPSLADLPASQYDRAVAAIEAKRGAAK